MVKGLYMFVNTPFNISPASCILRTPFPSLSNHRPTGLASHRPTLAHWPVIRPSIQPWDQLWKAPGPPRHTRRAAHAARTVRKNTKNNRLIKKNPFLNFLRRLTCFVNDAAAEYVMCFLSKQTCLTLFRTLMYAWQLLWYVIKVNFCNVWRAWNNLRMCYFVAKISSICGCDD